MLQRSNNHDGAVGIAVLSYDGRLYFGRNCDSDHVNDLPMLARYLVAAHDDLVTSFDGS